MKKILLISLLVIFALLPGVAMATTYNNDVPSGLTLLAWTVGPNQGGKNTVISFSYSGGFRASNEIDAPFDSSWHSLDDVRPILLAYQEGYGNYLGGTNGVFGSNIKFSDNVLAAMKAQNFNPSQIGGADIPPSSTTLNSDQTAWLQKMGYSVQATSQTASTSTSTQTQTHVQSQSSTQSSSTNTKQLGSTASTPVQESKTDSVSTVQSKPAIGETVQTPSGTMTPEMVAVDQKLSAENPPSQNPTNIPVKTPVQTETTSSKIQWIWVAGGTIIILILVASGWIIYRKHRTV